MAEERNVGQLLGDFVQLLVAQDGGEERVRNCGAPQRTGQQEVRQNVALRDA